MALLNFNWPSSDLLLMFYEFFENAAHEEPGNVEDDGSGQRVEDGRAALVLDVDLLGKQEKDSNSNSNSTENGKDVKDDESAKEKVREPDLALFVLSLCSLTNITHFLWMIISYRSVSRVLTY